MIAVQYTEADARSLNEKLAEFAKTLSRGECALLVDVFRRATEEMDGVEVEGHDAIRSAAPAGAAQSTARSPRAALSWFADYMDYLPLPERSR
jgi:hypothetical protein